jgi:hypothetical protein
MESSSSSEVPSSSFKAHLSSIDSAFANPPLPLMDTPDIPSQNLFRKKIAHVSIDLSAELNIKLEKFRSTENEENWFDLVWIRNATSARFSGVFTNGALSPQKLVLTFSSKFMQIISSWQSVKMSGVSWCCHVDIVQKSTIVTGGAFLRFVGHLDISIFWTEEISTPDKNGSRKF